MPPMLSDDESDSIDAPEVIPARAKAATQPVEELIEDDDDDDDDGEPDEYRVERILSHGFTKAGVPIYQIKWLGYEEEEDLTWEPKENLENAKDLLEEYHTKIGGEPVDEPRSKSTKKKGTAAKGGKRTASDAFAESPAPAASSKRKGRKSDTNGNSGDHLVTNKRELPVGSWEDHITRVTSIIEEPFIRKESGTSRVKDRTALTGLLEWNDGGPKTQHKLKVLRQKCPQKLLDYYEQHLVFNADA